MEIYLVCMFKESDYLPFSVGSQVYEMLFASNSSFAAEGFLKGYLKACPPLTDGFIVRIIKCNGTAFNEYKIEDV